MEGYPTVFAALSAVRKLPLRELALLNCHDLDLELFLPGAFLSLQKCHIEDSTQRAKQVRRQADMREELAVCGSNLLSLPDLYQLSGSGLLFTSVMSGVLKFSKWHVSKYSIGSMAKISVLGPAKAAKLRVWTRPQG